MSEPLNSQSEASNECVAEPAAEVVATPAEEAMVPSHLRDYQHTFETMSLESSSLFILSSPPGCRWTGVFRRTSGGAEAGSV